MHKIHGVQEGVVVESDAPPTQVIVAESFFFDALAATKVRKYSATCFAGD
jgi:hypothetical protein